MKKVIFFLLLILSACTVKPLIEYPNEFPYQPPVSIEYRASLMMVGDALLHLAYVYDGRKADGRFDFRPSLRFIAPIVKNYDLAFYNQETVFGGKELGYSNYPRFNSPSDFGEQMVEMGFNLVSLANNHTMDKGAHGALNSYNFWKNQPVITAGSWGSQEDRDLLRIYNINGITYAFLAYTYGTNGISVPENQKYIIDVYDEELIKKDIERYRDIVDFVIVSLHFGNEYNHIPQNRQKQMATFIAEQGADIIIGHHPHVIQPIDFIGNTLVVYSLGNFVSAQIGEPRLVEMIASVEMVKTVTYEKTYYRLENVKADLLYNHYTSSYKQFTIYPMSQIPLNLLPDRDALYQKYVSIITKLQPDRIKIGGFFDE
ncbi:MAG: capsule biosynthesis protein capA [Firmicutes bacterium HGW-Firmicutes-20]|jgi:poly-gamma-glutamate synthesis protein (capsule biosynthesis protein)|nr:MAG: capsule biosynthesis protein capA [Firmicutes bacterium HGW-Firmicutes-20]PKM65067.1 MAG: capsule biosynthesis protein capA [Firmicutes bacterium HGW-Firmicutes-19]